MRRRAKKRVSTIDSTGAGFFLGIPIHVFAQLLLIWAIHMTEGVLWHRPPYDDGHYFEGAPVEFIALCLWGQTQLVYMIPLYYVFRRRLPGFAKGLLINAGVMFTVTSPCLGDLIFKPW